MHTFWSLDVEFQVSVSGFLMKSQSRRFNQVSVSKATVSTTSLPIMLVSEQQLCWR